MRRIAALTKCHRAMDAPEPLVCLRCKKVGHHANYRVCECSSKRLQRTYIKLDSANSTPTRLTRFIRGTRRECLGKTSHISLHIPVGLIYITCRSYSPLARRTHSAYTEYRGVPTSPFTACFIQSAADDISVHMPYPP